MTGDGQPDCQGYYFYAGEHDGQPIYERTDAGYTIWKGPIVWNLSLAPGTTLPGYWFRPPGQPVEGVFGPYNAYTGNPIATALTWP